MNNFNGNNLYFTNMSPGLDVWRQECSSSNRDLLQPNNRGKSHILYHAMKDGKREPNEKESSQGHSTSNKVENNATTNRLKARKIFKFKLVEHLKDLLKPYWKESKIDKDVHKLIVKKSMTKVIDSFGKSGVPPSDQKIIEYFELAQSKLFKLIQAYVKKYQKAST